MNMNPFNEKPEKIDSLYMNWSQMYPRAYDKNDVDPYTKTRCILMNGTEFEANWFSHQFSRHCADNDVRRALATIRRSEQQQQKRIANVKPVNETILETTISYEQLAVDLTVALAKREKNEYVKHALDFALLEDFDHLYRYANLLELEQGVHAEKLIGSYTEIMPGRPTVSEHRYPADEICRFTDFKTADPLTKLNVSIITAAEQQTMNFYMNQAAFYTSDIGREMYSEIAMIEEEHVSRYGSLIDVNEGWLECWLMHEYAECYLYYSCYKFETDPYIKSVWEQHFIAEVAHLHFAKDMLKEKAHKEWEEVIPQGEFPELLNIESQKDYVRNVLKNTATETASREDYVDVSEMKDGDKFFRYQAQLNGDASATPSHVLIDRYIEEKGKDYRYEDREHPVPELRDRTVDNTALGRMKTKVHA